MNGFIFSSFFAKYWFQYVIFIFSFNLFKFAYKNTIKVKIIDANFVLWSCCAAPKGVTEGIYNATALLWIYNLSYAILYAGCESIKEEIETSTLSVLKKKDKRLPSHYYYHSHSSATDDACNSILKNLYRDWKSKRNRLIVK